MERDVPCDTRDLNCIVHLTERGVGHWTAVLERGDEPLQPIIEADEVSAIRAAVAAAAQHRAAILICDRDFNTTWVGSARVQKTALQWRLAQPAPNDVLAAGTRLSIDVRRER